MTTERNALGLSLLASVKLASLQQTDCYNPIHAGFRGHDGLHTHHIRGGNP